MTDENPLKAQQDRGLDTKNPSKALFVFAHEAVDPLS